MPHYKDGTPAKPGDIVIGKAPEEKTKHLGVVLEVYEAESCSLGLRELARVIEDGEGARTILLAETHWTGTAKDYSKVA